MDALHSRKEQEDRFFASGEDDGAPPPDAGKDHDTDETGQADPDHSQSPGDYGPPDEN